jgi:hypothetical protein
VTQPNFYSPRTAITAIEAATWANLRKSAIADLARAATYTDTHANTGKTNFYKARATRKMRKFMALKYPLATAWAATDWANLDPALWPT